MASATVTVIRPKKSPVYPVDEYLIAIEKVCITRARAMQADFNRTTRTWTTRVEWELSIKNRIGRRATEVSVRPKPGAPGTKIYQYVSRGTRPHTIRPKKAKVLRFNKKYRAKTKPRVLGSTRGGSSPPMVVAKVVHHPGTEARLFEEEIARRHQPRFEREMAYELGRIIRKHNAQS